MELVEQILDGRLAHLRDNCPEDITDLVFLEIERNAELHAQYNHLVGTSGVDAANAMIGRAIKEHWNLKNLGECRTPKSTLIKSYERHTNVRL